MWVEVRFTSRKSHVCARAPAWQQMALSLDLWDCCTEALETTLPNTPPLPTS